MATGGFGVNNLHISTASKEYVRAEVEANINGVPYDPTGDTVMFAFTATDNLVGASWYTGSWETGGTTGYIARCLVGPGVVDLAKGTYVIHVKVTDNPEVPIKRAGVLVVY